MELNNEELHSFLLYSPFAKKTLVAKQNVIVAMAKQMR